MTWTKAKIRKNTDNTKIVSLRTVYTDATYGDFTFSEERVDITNLSIAVSGFSSRANAAKDAWLTDNTPSTKEALLLTKLNA